MPTRFALLYQLSDLERVQEKVITVVVVVEVVVVIVDLAKTHCLKASN